MLLTTEERFWQRVDMTGECWLWLGALNEERERYHARKKGL